MIMMQCTVTSSTSVETKTADSVRFSSNYKCMIAYIYNDTLKMYVYTCTCINITCTLHSFKFEYQ